METSFYIWPHEYAYVEFGTSWNCIFLQEEDKTKDLPFIIGIQTPLQIVWLLEFGHNESHFMDATIGTMCKGTTFSPWWCLTIIVKVYQSSMGNMSWQTKLDLIQWLLALKEHTLKEDPTSRPSCFIVNDALQECDAIKYNTQFTYLDPFCFM